MRVLALTKRMHGNAAAGAVYEAIGSRVHDAGGAIDDPEVIRTALRDADIDDSAVERALGDASTMDEIRRDHDAAVNEVGAFGVPTIITSSGKGIFGPVIATAPSGSDALELWEHVKALTDLDYFFELKRERDRPPGR